eukprot:gene10715-7446_t
MGTFISLVFEWRSEFSAVPSSGTLAGHQLCRSVQVSAPAAAPPLQPSSESIAAPEKTAPPLGAAASSPGYTLPSPGYTLPGASPPSFAADSLCAKPRRRRCRARWRRRRGGQRPDARGYYYPMAALALPPERDAAGAAVELEEELQELGPLDCVDVYAFLEDHAARTAAVPPLRFCDSAVFRHPANQRLTPDEIRCKYVFPPLHAAPLALAGAPPGCAAPLLLAAAAGPGEGSGDVLRSSRSFYSVVQELRDACEADPAGIAVSWRRVEHVTPSSAAGPSRQRGALAQAVGSGLAQFASAYSLSRRAYARSQRHVYYLGPQQHWSRMEWWHLTLDMAHGLRRLGLKPGNKLLLVDDTRWELLLACYAAWAAGLVVALVPPSLACLRQAAVDLREEVKAVVCPRDSRVLGLVRRCWRDAEALHHEVEAEQASAQLQHGLDPSVSATLPDDGSPALDGTPLRSGRHALALSPGHGPLFITTERLVTAAQEEAPAAGEEDSAAQAERADAADDGSGASLWWGDVLEHGQRWRRFQQQAEEAQQGQRSTSAGAGAREVEEGRVDSDRAAFSPFRSFEPAPAQRSPVPAPLRATDLALILYASGEPKGILHTHGGLRAAMTGYEEQLRRMGQPLRPPARPRNGDGEELRPDPRRWLMEHVPPAGLNPTPRAYESQPAYVAHMPITHFLTELVLELVLLPRGFRVCYGSAHTLWDNQVARPRCDVQEYCPTLILGVPAVFHRLCALIEGSLTSGGLPRRLFDISFEHRRQALRRGFDTPFLNRSAFQQPRQMLGGRCAAVMSVGAPLSAAVLEFLHVVCGVAVHQVYGLKESAACGLVQTFGDGFRSSVGGPLGPIEVKIRGSRQGGEPTRGELLLRGPTIMCGYHHQAQQSIEVMEPSADGESKSWWLRTGDVAERCPSDGSFRILGPVKNVFKNTIGIAMGVESLEQLYAEHQLCSPGGICIVVHPYRSYICGLVLTNEERANAFSRHPGIEAAPPRRSPMAVPAPASSGWPHCLRDPTFNAAAAASLNRFAVERGGVLPHELLRHVRVLYDEWTPANALRTSTGRLHRHHIAQRYRGVMEEMFEELL